jgi:hypothetical protein
VCVAHASQPRLQQALEARGYSCFVGEKQLEGGDEWATTIARAVKGCRAMLIVSSPTYGMTKWTFRELQMADNNQKKLVRTNTRQHSSCLYAHLLCSIVDDQSIACTVRTLHALLRICNDTKLDWIPD